MKDAATVEGMDGSASDSGSPVIDGCVPTTDECALECGTIDDGCGRQLVCGEACSEYEMCLDHGCRKCTLFADHFDRADSDMLGTADFPGDALWVQSMGDYDVASGTLTRKVSGGAIPTTADGVINADIGAGYAGIYDRIRMRYTVRFDEAMTFANAGFNFINTDRTGLSVSVFQSGTIYLWEGSDLVT